MIDVDVVVTSMNEPQLDRCLEALRNQTYPFYRIININGVIPFSDAYNRILDSVKTEWYVPTAGDVIYDKNALEQVMWFKDRKPGDKCCSYCMYTWDPFLEIKCGFMCLQRTSAFVPHRASNNYNLDRKTMRNIRSQGWFLRKYDRIVGTHFLDPDEYQVFHRFMILAGRDGMGSYNSCKEICTRLYERDHNPLHALALDALEFGLQKGNYPDSINDNYNRKMYEEFKEWKLTH